MAGLGRVRVIGQLVDSLVMNLQNSGGRSVGRRLTLTDGRAYEESARRYSTRRHRVRRVRRRTHVPHGSHSAGAATHDGCADADTNSGAYAYADARPDASHTAGPSAGPACSDALRRLARNG